MKKIGDYLSTCCNAFVYANFGLPDFMGDDVNSPHYVGTCSFVCIKCNKPCNVKNDNNQD